MIVACRYGRLLSTPRNQLVFPAGNALLMMWWVAKLKRRKCNLNQVTWWIKHTNSNEINSQFLYQFLACENKLLFISEREVSLYELVIYWPEKRSATLLQENHASAGQYENGDAVAALREVAYKIGDFPEPPRKLVNVCWNFQLGRLFNKLFVFDCFRQRRELAAVISPAWSNKL